MITSRISSGFDLELQLGAGWFRTALDLLNEKGLLAPPGMDVVITNVQISFEPDWNLQIDVENFPFPILAKAELVPATEEIVITTNIPLIPPRTIPFNVLKDVSGVPEFVKLAGDLEHEHVIALLANLKIHAESQSEEPRDIETDPLPRGNIDDAQSFLPLGKDIAFGLSKETLSRFANNLWHTELRAEDGTHPLPDSENKRGDWSKVAITGGGGKIRIKLEGDIPVDSPIIDVVPDPHVTITLTITPQIVDGKLTFSIEPDTDVDTGLLGDIFGAITGGLGGGIVGGIIGFIIGLVTGGILSAVLTGLVIGAGIGLVLGVIVIEVAEVIVEGIVQKEIKAKLNGEVIADILCRENGIVQVATQDTDAEFNLSLLDSIPPSIPIHTDFPENENLYQTSLLVLNVYDDFTADENGFAVAGMSGMDEKFQPEIATITSFNYTGEVLETITYRRNDGQQQTLTVTEVLERAAIGELKAPFKLFNKPEEASFRIPEGKLPCVTLQPISIKREDSIVTEIVFENGVRIKVPDAIMLQDAAAIVVTGYQLIHPRDYNPYYRAVADFIKDNNFERLPEID